MIPLWASLHIHNANGTMVRLWLPLFLLWLLLLPLMLLLVPIALIVCLLTRINPLGAFVGVWRVASASRGTHIDVAEPRARVLFHLY